MSPVVFSQQEYVNHPETLFVPTGKPIFLPPWFCPKQYPIINEWFSIERQNIGNDLQ
jgi:hypothetical protein